MPATLDIRNAASSDLTLTLDAAASHAAWGVELPDDPQTVPAGESLSVPVTIVVPPDAATDIPVRVTVRARSADGAQATAFTEITPLAGVAAVGADHRVAAAGGPARRAGRGLAGAWG